jgi:MFS family permease
MNTLFHREKLDKLPETNRSKIIQVMTLNDITYWATDAFVGVILILFVLQFIQGGSATHFGLAFLVYKGASALLSIPIGRFFDKHKGHIDELWALVGTSVASGSVYMSLSFANELWHLYLAMAALGVVSTVNLIAWRTLFYSNIEAGEYGRTIGIYQAFMSMGQGLALALGGFVGDRFGFDTVVFYGGAVIALGGFLPLTIKRWVTRS